MIVAQLEELLLQRSEVRGSNPVIANFYMEHMFTVNCIEKTKIKEKSPVMAHFLKTMVRECTAMLPKWFTNTLPT